MRDQMEPDQEQTANDTGGVQPVATAVEAAPTDQQTEIRRPPQQPQQQRQPQMPPPNDPRSVPQPEPAEPRPQAS